MWNYLETLELYLLLGEARKKGLSRVGSGFFGLGFRDFRVFLSGSGFREHAGVLGLQGSKVRVVGLL